MAMPMVPLQQYLQGEKIKARFAEILGKNAPAFMSAILSIYNGNPLLQKCDNKSIIGAAGLAATVNLSISPAMGQAYIVPFRSKDSYQAQFQIGVRGMIQLAHRTGQYSRLHAGAVYEGEITGFNPVTGEPIIGERTGDKVVGYIAYMKLINGFEKAVYMSTEEIEAHAYKYSQSYKSDKNKGWRSSPWTTNFDSMASKTVLKRLLKNYGILSAEMAEVFQADMGVVDKSSVTYVDNGGDIQPREEIYAPDIDIEPFFDSSDSDSFDAETGELKDTLTLTSLKQGGESYARTAI